MRTTKAGIGLSFFSMLWLAACGAGGDGSTGSGASSQNAVSVTADMTVTWDSPNTTVDQSCLQSVSGYRVYVGLSPGVYSTSAPVSIVDAACSETGQNACGAIQTCTYTVHGLAGWSGGSWHFAVTAYDDGGNESAYSTEASYAIN